MHSGWWPLAFHTRVADALCFEGRRGDVLGFVMDNTKTNRAALKMLSAVCPQWIVLGCAAHGLDLVIKDFAKDEGKRGGCVECPGLKRVYDMVKLMSNVVGDCEGVRQLLTAVQEGSGGKSKRIARHMPTRFGVLHSITRDLLQCEDSIKSMVLHARWKEASKGSKHAKAFRDAVVGE